MSGAGEIPPKKEKKTFVPPPGGFEKKKKLTKAERRELQDRQRAAKQAVIAISKRTRKQGASEVPSGSASEVPSGSASEPGGSASEPASSASEPAGSASEPGSSASEPGSSASEPGSSASEPVGSASEPWGSASEPWGSASEPWGSASEPVANDRVEQMRAVQAEALSLFAAKNADYGDAFASYGVPGVLMRMSDKLMRFQKISRTGIQLVNDEKLRDTLMDLHNYAAMALLLLDEDTVADAQN